MTSVLDKEAYTKTDSSCVPIVIPDERQLLKKDESTVFLYPPEYEGNLEGVLIASHEILERTSSLARKIREDYRCKRPMMICVLKGAGVYLIALCHVIFLSSVLLQPACGASTRTTRVYM
mmetsp:Transcript_22147/g.32345  ORF Transcript_22147/g.32345 Transcript_22147/m.32345 type:complete len:120 (+) Transcript_22147:159-518(+)